MAYINWEFGRPSIASLHFEVDITNDPGINSHLYLQLYDGSIDGTGQYFGLQTNGLVLFSQFGSNDLSRIELGPNSLAVPGTNEGLFISLRSQRDNLPVGRYSIDVMRTEPEPGRGDWFEYWVTYPNEDATYVGAVLFPRSRSSQPASFADNGGTWVEDWDNSTGREGAPVRDVELWDVSVAVSTDGHDPIAANLSYGYMPNANITPNPDRSVDITVGGETPRCTQPGRVDFTGLDATPSISD